MKGTRDLLQDIRHLLHYKDSKRRLQKSREDLDREMDEVLARLSAQAKKEAAHAAGR